MTDLSCLLNKTIERIDSSTHEEFVLVHFTDGTLWLVVAETWNCAGAKLDHKLSCDRSYGPSDTKKDTP